MYKRLFLIFISMLLIGGLLSACNTSKLQTIGTDQYYVQITGEGNQYETGYEPRYEYELIGYDEAGNEQNLFFTTRQQLKQGAFIRIYYKKKTDEVIYYEEVEKDTLHEKVLEGLNLSFD